MMRNHLVTFIRISRPLVLHLVHFIQMLRQVLLQLLGRDRIRQINLPLTTGLRATRS